MMNSFLPPALAGLLVLGLTVSVQAQSRAPLSAENADRVVPVEIQKSARHNFRIVTVAKGLDHPWSMAWLPGGEMLVTERTGRLRIIRDGRLEPEPVAGLPRVYREKGQGGFMDVLPHPNFAANRLLYLSYGKPNENGSQGATTVVRGRLEGNQVVGVEEIFEAKAWGTNNNHFAGRMAFDRDGYLFIAVGDRMVSPDLMANHPAQDLTNHMGKIIRLRDDGSVPPDNPFVGRKDALPEIWSYGHRNEQGLAVHPVTGEVWATEHGPRGGDELNLIVRGGNYGWPVVSYGIHYNGSVFTKEMYRKGIEAPVFVWIPSIGTSGLMIYSGDKFPWWQGSVFVGGMVGERLMRVTLAGQRAVSEETLLGGVLGRIRDVRQGPDGFIYLAIEDDKRLLTEVVRLEPVAGDVAPPR